MSLHKQETRLKKAHIALMKHPMTALYSGVMLMGKSDVSEQSFTAYTDGVNKRYSAPYMETITSEAELRGIVLHENLHVALKQLPRGKHLWKENSKMANLAADFVVNDVIANIDGKVIGGTEPIVSIGESWVYDPMFHDWSMQEIYNYLKKHAKSKPRSKPHKGEDGSSGNEQSNDPQDGGSQDEPEVVEINGKEYDISKQDEHDWESVLDGLTHEQLKDLNDGIDKALREGGILAGRMGAKLPRVIGELLEPKVDWREVLRDFVTSSTRGKDEMTWRRMNRRQLANDIYMPSVINETIGEVVVAIDTSGSIGSEELSVFATELASICEVVEPEVVRILWWDTQVAGQQVFNGNYQDIVKALKPEGGGGTHVSCVSEYIEKEKINAECVIVFTDGYVESDIKWGINIPTLWLVTDNKALEVPSGKKVTFDKDN